MERGQRHLGGADQIQVVVGQPVDLLLGVGQHAGADQRALAHEHRRDHRLEALLDQLGQRVLDERELEQHQPAAQVGEARAGQSGAALHVDHRPGQLEVIAAGAPGLADLTQHRVGGGRIRDGTFGSPSSSSSSSPRTVVSRSVSSRPRAASAAICWRSSSVGAPRRPLLKRFCSARSSSS